MARRLHAAGHRVTGADTSARTVCRYSRAMADHVVVPSPRHDTEGFLAAINRTIEEKQIDCFIPTFEETIYVSQHRDKLPADCRVICGKFESVRRLHSKWLFIERLKELGFPAVRTELIASQDELHSYDFRGHHILKASYSRSALEIHKVSQGMKPPQVIVEPHNPWVAQEFLQGKKYCTYSVCHDGKVDAHTTYPVQIGLDDSSCVMYEAIDHPGILDWVERFIAAENLSGQVAFDFIEVADGTLYAIECNPRLTAGLHLFDNDGRLANAFLAPPEIMVQPKVGTKRQLLIAMLMYGWKSSSSNQGFGRFAKHLFSCRDVVFSADDIKPFLVQPFLMRQYVRFAKQHHLPIPGAFLHDLEWNGDKL
jgi:ATP-grasp domain